MRVPKSAVTPGNFSCNLQRNDDESIARQVAEDMSHPATSRNVVKSRRLVYLSCNSQRNFSLRDRYRRAGVYNTTRNFVRNLSRNGVALQVAEKIASYNSALSRYHNEQCQRFPVLSKT